MKIIEALKRLPVIEKRIQKNITLIDKYSCGLDLGETKQIDFESVEEQEKEVKSLLQSVEDLVYERASLRRRLSVTNSQTIVKIGGVEKTITEWIELRNVGMESIVRSYQALRTDSIEQKIRSGGVQINTDHGLKTIKFYNEKDRNAKIEEFENIRDSIDAELEKVNATTDMLD